MTNVNDRDTESIEPGTPDWRALNAGARGEIRQARRDPDETANPGVVRSSTGPRGPRFADQWDNPYWKDATATPGTPEWGDLDQEERQRLLQGWRDSPDHPMAGKYDTPYWANAPARPGTPEWRELDAGVRRQWMHDWRASGEAPEGLFLGSAGNASTTASRKAQPRRPEPSDVQEWVVCSPVRIGSLVLRIQATSVEIRDRLDALLIGLRSEVEEDLVRAIPHSTDEAAVWGAPSGIGAQGADADSVVDVRWFTYRSGRQGNEHEYHELWVGGHRKRRDRHAFAIEEQLLVQMNRWVLDADSVPVHLHAGGVATAEGSGVVLLVGDSGAGKSTLTSHLLRRGWHYLSDEMLAVGSAGEIGSYPRPPTLKRAGWDLFADTVPIPANAHRRHERLHLSLAELGTTAVKEPRPAALVALLERGDGPPSSSRVDPCELLESLIASTFDLQRSGVEGMKSLARLAQRTPAVRLAVGDLDAAEQHLRALVLDVHRAVELEILEPTEAGAELKSVTAATRPRRGSSVWTFRYDSGAVLYDILAGTVVRIDASSSDVWVRFDGSRSIADIASEVGIGGASADSPNDLVRFVEVLRRSGMVSE